MKKIILITLCGIFSILSCEKPEEEEKIGYGIIQGFTYIASTNEPLSGLKAEVPDYGTRITDENGFFKFENVEEGAHTVNIYQGNNLVSSKQTHVIANNTVTLWFPFEYAKKDQPEFLPIDLSSEEVSNEYRDWDYMVLGKHECFYIDKENSKPKAVLYHTQDNKDYLIVFNEDGLPSKITTPEHWIFLLDNFNGNKVDLAGISPSGDIKIAREIYPDQLDFTWLSSFPLDKSTQSRAGFIRWTARILGAIPCVTSGAAALASFGTAIPLDVLALWTCTNYLLGMGVNFFDDAGISNGFTNAVQDYKLLIFPISCSIDVASCLYSAAISGLEDYADYVEEMDEREDDIRVAESALYTGHGDIQITLTWDNEADLDLHVLDPFEEEIYFKNRSSESGGMLDYDDMNGYGPENIYWPKGKAPLGLYEVSVHHFPWEDKPSSSNYTVLINAFGKVKKFTGHISFDEEKMVAFFDQNDIYVVGSKSMPFESKVFKITRTSKK
jgi:hypothetical protein